MLMSGLIFSTVRRLQGSVRRASLRALLSLLQLGSVLFVGINVLNAAGVLFHQEPGPYLAAITWGSSLAGYMFVRLLLHALW